MIWETFRSLKASDNDAWQLLPTIPQVPHLGKCLPTSSFSFACSSEQVYILLLPYNSNALLFDGAWIFKGAHAKFVASWNTSCRMVLCLPHLVVRMSTGRSTMCTLLAA